MCHGHVDLKYIEREVRDRLNAAQAAPKAVADDDDVTVPPGLIGGLPGLVARLRCLLKGRVRTA